MIPWLPDSGMRTVQMHENLFIWNNKNSNIYTALSSIVSAKLIDTPFIYGFLLITPCHFQSAWCFCVSLFVLLGQACQNLFISFCCYLLVKIMPHTYTWIHCDWEKGGKHLLFSGINSDVSPMMEGFSDFFSSRFCIALSTGVCFSVVLKQDYLLAGCFLNFFSVHHQLIPFFPFKSSVTISGEQFSLWVL